MKRLKSEAMAFYKSSPAGHRDYVAKHVIKKRKKETNRKNELGSPRNWADRASRSPACFLKAIASAASPFCSKTLYTKSPIATQITAKSQTPCLEETFLPSMFSLLMLWKEIRDHKESTVVLVKAQVLHKELRAQSPQKTASRLPGWDQTTW